ncbi:MAG: PhzF family phenazine biosynthesis protein [Pseudomonadota bacterium]
MKTTNSRRLRFSIYDVFSDVPMRGNQLGIVYDAGDLNTATMQTIAREFNFPETIFLMDASGPQNAARVRIFTPQQELPFAGHPTVGAAVAVGDEQGLRSIGHGRLVLEEAVGPVQCSVRFGAAGAFGQFDLPVIATPAAASPSDEALAEALNLEPSDIGFENHRPSIYDGGLAYQLIPVRSLEAIGRAKPNAAVWEEVFNENAGWSAYVYCRETVHADASFHARMFAPQAGIPEDPATGSAVSSLVGAIIAFDTPADGTHAYIIEQGIEMGRGSKIYLELDMSAGQAMAGRIGGAVCAFAEGYLQC